MCDSSGDPGHFYGEVRTGTFGSARFFNLRSTSVRGLLLAHQESSGDDNKCGSAGVVPNLLRTTRLRETHMLKPELFEAICWIHSPSSISGLATFWQPGQFKW